ncbi:MAG: imidazole glycerol phosphate synthase subunit HisF [Clostridiales bacterium]|nr:imidazole glycerol phosphate synthase subunit HisF [Clostridiales bacterium]
MGIKRIIPCLDVCNGKVVKGINFIGFREVGDPVECAMDYVKQGADEIVFLDITATNEGRGTIVDLVRETADNISVPLIVGGGVRNVEDIRRLLEAGASKVSINSAAVKRPELLREATEEFGRECIVLAIDGRKTEKDRFNVMINGGMTDTGMDLVDWARKGESLGAGEILLTSMDADGVKNGFDLPMLSAVCNAVSIPVIASGGCGTVGHFVRVFQETGCDAALAASIFHYGDLTVNTVKNALKERGISVKLKEKGACA